MRTRLFYLARKLSIGAHLKINVNDYFFAQKFDRGYQKKKRTKKEKQSSKCHTSYKTHTHTHIKKLNVQQL